MFGQHPYANTHKIQDISPDKTSFLHIKLTLGIQYKPKTALY